MVLLSTIVLLLLTRSWHWIDLAILDAGQPTACLELSCRIPLYSYTRSLRSRKDCDRSAVRTWLGEIFCNYCIGIEALHHIFRPTSPVLFSLRIGFVGHGSTAPADKPHIPVSNLVYFHLLCLLFYLCLIFAKPLVWNRFDPFDFLVRVLKDTQAILGPRVDPFLGLRVRRYDKGHT